MAVAGRSDGESTAFSCSGMELAGGSPASPGTRSARITRFRPICCPAEPRHPGRALSDTPFHYAESLCAEPLRRWLWNFWEFKVSAGVPGQLPHHVPPDG